MFFFPQSLSCFEIPHPLTRSSRHRRLIPTMTHHSTSPHQKLDQNRITWRSLGIVTWEGFWRLSGTHILHRLNISRTYWTRASRAGCHPPYCLWRNTARKIPHGKEWHQQRRPAAPHLHAVRHNTRLNDEWSLCWHISNCWDDWIPREQTWITEGRWDATPSAARSGQRLSWAGTSNLLKVWWSLVVTIFVWEPEHGTEK